MRRSWVRHGRVSFLGKQLATLTCLAWLLANGHAAAEEDAGRPAIADAGTVIPVRIVHDLVYRDLVKGEDPSKDKNKLDLYLPRGCKDFPVLFFVHGGAWSFGDKNQLGMYSALGLSMARQGIGVVVINYRLSPGVQHPEHIKDVAKAFAWTHKNIQKYGGRPDQIFACGHSAGGHLVALLASDESYLKNEGLNLQAIKGVIPISGVFRIHDLQTLSGLNLGAGEKSNITGSMRVRSARVGMIFTNDLDVRKQASPISHVRPGLPPFLVIYADHDISLLPPMAKEFVSALEEKKCEVQSLEAKQRTHISILLDATTDDDPVNRAIRAFIVQHTGKS
jgi:acetyl esterase/lipase